MNMQRNRWLVVKGICFVIFWVFSAIWVSAQTSDLDLILEQDFRNSKFNERNIRFGFDKEAGFVKKYNPVSLFFSGSMFFYQNLISPQFSASCLYNPSCSSYSKKLIAEFGLVKGIICSSDRLMRCNKLTATALKPYEINPEDHKFHENTSYYRIKKHAHHHCWHDSIP